MASSSFASLSRSETFSGGTTAVSARSSSQNTVSSASSTTILIFEINSAFDRARQTADSSPRLPCHSEATGFQLRHPPVFLARIEPRRQSVLQTVWSAVSRPRPDPTCSSKTQQLNPTGFNDSMIQPLNDSIPTSFPCPTSHAGGRCLRVCCLRRRPKAT